MKPSRASSKKVRDELKLFVGYSTLIKKRQPFDEIIEAAKGWRGSLGSNNRPTSITFVPLQDEKGKPITNLPRLHAVLHKRTDDMASVLTTRKPESVLHIDHLENVLSSPFNESDAQKVVAIDQLQNVWNLLDRKSISQTIDHLAMVHSPIGTLRNVREFRALPWLIISVRDTNESISQQLAQHMTFPIVLKRRLAAGFPETHDMAIAWNPESAITAIRTWFASDLGRSGGSSRASHGGRDAQFIGRENIGSEVIAQEYISNHAGVIFKVYGIGSNVSVHTKLTLLHDVQRPRTGCFFYHSHKIYNERKLEDSSLQQLKNAGESMKPSKTLVTTVISSLANGLGITMIGADMLYDVRSRKYSVIDVNYFPSFRGVPNHCEKVLDNICQLVSKQMG